MKDFGNNFYIFLLFLPIYLIHYLRLALTNGKFNDWLRLVYGTFVGLTLTATSKKIIFAGERPSLSDIDGLHLAKYKFALPFCKGKSILEIGCGTGYGSEYMIKNGVKKILAFDIDPQAINFAKKNFLHDNINFSEADVETLKLRDQFDVVLSFEVIEHLNQPHKLLELAKKHVKKGGIFILSTPNKAFSILDGGRPSNPYHVYEYYPKELKEILMKYFKTVQLYGVILNNKKKAKEEKVMQSTLRWKIANILANKRSVRKIMNFLPEYPKRLITGESKLLLSTNDFQILRNKAEQATDFIAISK